MLLTEATDSSCSVEAETPLQNAESIILISNNVTMCFFMKYLLLTYFSIEIPLICCAELYRTAILLKIIGIERWLKCKTWCFLLFFIAKFLPLSYVIYKKRIPLPCGKAMRHNPVIFKHVQSGRTSRAEHLSSRPDNACRRVCVSFPVYHLS